MIGAVKDIIDEAIDDGGLADSLVAQENYFIFEEGRDCSFWDIEVAYIIHYLYYRDLMIKLSLQLSLQPIVEKLRKRIGYVGNVRESLYTNKILINYPIITLRFWDYIDRPR